MMELTGEKIAKAIRFAEAERVQPFNQNKYILPEKIEAAHSRVERYVADSRTERSIKSARATAESLDAQFETNEVRVAELDQLLADLADPSGAIERYGSGEEFVASVNKCLGWKKPLTTEDLCRIINWRESR